MDRVRLLSDLSKGDVVRTPCGQSARVVGFEHDAVVLQYLHDGDEVALRPYMLVLVSRARPHDFPASFFQ